MSHPGPHGKVAALLLAAGGGSRFRSSAAAAGIAVSHKLLAPVGGTTVVERAYAAMDEGAPGDAPRIVVTGAAVLPALRDARIVPNDRWAEGQATSLWAGLDAARALGCTGVVVGLGDQPFIDPADWRAVFDAAAEGAVIAVATYGGKRRNPVYLAASTWALIPTSGDEGARSVLAGRPDLVTQVVCLGTPADIDTAEDLLRWS